jgi:phosphate-induced protein 1
MFAAVLVCFSVFANAQTARDATHLRPTGKGWAAESAPDPEQRWFLGRPRVNPASNGIYYHGGSVMAGNVNLYFIWYGNFVDGPASSDSIMTQQLVEDLFGAGGLGGSLYARINTTYSDGVHSVTGNFALKESANDYYSRGKILNDTSIMYVVASAINSRVLPKDTNGVYFVLTSSDVSESSGFCNRYCGWHNHAAIGGRDIRIAFVGNPDRCPTACEEQRISPNRDSGADGIASVVAHEVIESTNDPGLNAWYDTNGNESADKCAWKWGPVIGRLGNGAYNMTVAGHHWLIQMNWENARGGGCDQKLGGRFYNQ